MISSRSRRHIQVDKSEVDELSTTRRVLSWFFFRDHLNGPGEIRYVSVRHGAIDLRSWGQSGLS
jgi:hypothetical protein